VQSSDYYILGYLGSTLASLGGRLVGAVLGAVAGDHLVVAGIAAQGEGDLDDVVAGLHQHEDALHLLLLLVAGQLALHVVHQRFLGDLAAAMEEILDHVEEARILGGGHILEAVGNLVLGGIAAARLHHSGGQCLGQRGQLLLAAGALAGQTLQVIHAANRLDSSGSNSFFILFCTTARHSTPHQTGRGTRIDMYIYVGFFGAPSFLLSGESGANFSPKSSVGGVPARNAAPPPADYSLRCQGEIRYLLSVSRSRFSLTPRLSYDLSSSAIC